MTLNSDQQPAGSSPLARFSLAAALVACALFIQGCTASGLYDVGHAPPPISSKMLAEMRKVGVTAESPVLVRIFKAESELEVWKQTASGKYVLLKTYPMCRWSGKLGPKKTNGDRQAPEGFYSVSAGMLNPNSKFFLSFNIGYPNQLEQALGYNGKELMVHGACSSSGCFAISDQNIGEVYPIVAKALASGQSGFQVQSYPFRMTQANMTRHAGDPNAVFWANLKQGYDRFGMTRRPLQISYCEKRYVFDGNPADFISGDPLAACPPAYASAKTPIADNLYEQAATDMAFATVGPQSGVYTDGGMHPMFKALLKKYGAKKLAAQVSNTAYPISRPDAALSSPEPNPQTE